MKNKITLTRGQAIEDLLNRVNYDWDMDRLLDYVNHNYLDYLEKCSVEDLTNEYLCEFGMLDNDEDEEVEILDTAATKILFDKKV